MIELDREVCSDLEAALEREWLETDGLGGYASSTIAGINTRRYHGLLVAALKPPSERYVLLSKLEETLVIDGKRFDLSANRYPGTVHPEGYRYLKRFRLDPFPIFTYEAGGCEVEKTVFMVHSLLVPDAVSTCVIQYRINPPGSVPGGNVSARGSVHLEVRPLIAFRGYHGLTRRNDALNPGIRTGPGTAAIEPYHGLPALTFAHDAADLHPTGEWFFNLQYDRERERGLDYEEDLFNPCVLRFDGHPLTKATLIASTGRPDAGQAEDLRRAEIDRRRDLQGTAPPDEFIRPLFAAADQFIVARGEERSVIAGYHWFTDWGRDTMIALPGLALATGRVGIAQGILMEFARHADQGMIPNRFPDAGETPDYNTVDATLWFFQAAHVLDALLRRTGDPDGAWIRKSLYDMLADMIDWHVRGTRYGIGVDDDGLLASGEAGVQLTWMDAKVGDWVVTPRHGKPVEIQALWYNALRIMEGLAGRYGDGDREKRCRDLADRAQRAFNKAFWNEAAGCLYDVVNGEERDGSMRPNQILAVSLPHTMVPAARAKAVVAAVERDLLTPYGLRSLAPGDPRYCGRYIGDPRSRDGAYHQGTVWPWLMGPFITAYLKVNNRTQRSHQRAAEWLRGFQRHLGDAGLGQVSEIFDGDPPHRPRGCIAQAWSVAELLRVAIEEGLGG